jgi:hypothetical protein
MTAHRKPTPTCESDEPERLDRENAPDDADESVLQPRAGREPRTDPDRHHQGGRVEQTFPEQHGAKGEDERGKARARDQEAVDKADADPHAEDDDQVEPQGSSEPEELCEDEGADRNRGHHGEIELAADHQDPHPEGQDPKVWRKTREGEEVRPLEEGVVRGEDLENHEEDDEDDQGE